MRIEREEARRVAVRAQLLDADRPTDLLDVVTRLTFLQIDPTAAVAPSADLVAWSRLGPGYRPAELTGLLERDRSAFEHRAMIRPMSDLRLHRAWMQVWPGDEWAKAADWLAANAGFHRDVLALLRDRGPVLSSAVPDTAQEAWPSSGWTNSRNVTQMLEFLAARGEVAVSGRRGRQRVWDLAERIYPGGRDTDVVPLEEARALQDERRLSSLGIARAQVVGRAGQEVEVEGTAGVWRVDPAQLGRPFAGRTALLSPFDRLVHDRVRAQELFGFEYVLEMYKPAAARRWGYFALPVLHHDRLVGKLDAKADRKAGVLRITAFHEDVRIGRTVRRDVDAEIDSLATWLGLTRDG